MQELSPETTISHYRIVSKLGAGGMGVVYLAEDTTLDRKVALKLLPSDAAVNRERMDRFVREAKSAAALNHPNIAHIYEIGESDGTRFIAMEFIDGETLREKIHLDHTPLSKLLKYLSQVAEGLAKSHAAGIVHRDLKPDNIMITHEDHAKVLDFGLAKLVESSGGFRADDINSSEIATTMKRLKSVSGMVLGTVGYMSPEQAQGKTNEIDHRSDIFSFGCVLFEAITKHKPFDDESVIKSLHKIIYEPPPPLKEFNPSAPADLQRVVRRCLAKDPDQRYQAIKDVAIELQEVISEMEGADSVKTAAFHRNDVRTGDQAINKAAGKEAPSTAKILAESTTASSRIDLVLGHIKRNKVAVSVVLAFLLLGAGIVGYFSYRGTGVAIDSIAVLPFENRSGDAETEYLSDGLAESLIYRLSQLPNLRVSPTSMAFRYKGRQLDAIKVGNELGVSAVLVGRITQRGDNLTISAELVDVRNSKLLWGEQYDRKMSDLLATQRQIAREIVERLELKVSGNEKGLAKEYTESNEAYQLYLRGQFYWNKRSEEAMRKSLGYYEQAIAKDPEFALAYSGVANAYCLLGAPEATGVMPPSEAMPKAKEAALKALEIDNTLAEPHLSLAHVKYYYDHDFAAAEREYTQAIELNPNYPTAPQWYSVYLMSVGRFDEALTQVKRAQELDPLSLPINMTLGWVLLTTRRNDQSVEQLRKTLEMDPSFILTHHRLGLVYEQQGKYDDAIAEFRQVVNLAGRKPLGLAALAHAYALSGQRAEAQKILTELDEQSKQHFVSSASVAVVYVALGNKDQAFASLEKAYESGDGLLVRLKVDSRYDNIRSDPRFADLAKRVGLTP